MSPSFRSWTCRSLAKPSLYARGAKRIPVRFIREPDLASCVGREPKSSNSFSEFRLSCCTEMHVEPHFLPCDPNHRGGFGRSHENSLQVVELDTGKSVFEIGNAADGRLSPDGHWFAYDDLASGEMYVAPFPGPGARIAVSTGGGGDPRWRGYAQELFYVSDDMSVVSVQVRESAKEFKVISSTKLFRLQLP